LKWLCWPRECNMYVFATYTCMLNQLKGWIRQLWMYILFVVPLCCNNWVLCVIFMMFAYSVILLIAPPSSSSNFFFFICLGFELRNVTVLRWYD
jgi:hypothetical protein